MVIIFADFRKAFDTINSVDNGLSLSEFKAHDLFPLLSWN